MEDLPDRRVARFKCKTCGKRFTRSYDGGLLTKERRRIIRPGEPPTVPKLAPEIKRLKEMGLQGLDNREIARRLGWGEKTVRMYWISLDIEADVHHAQARRRDEERGDRHSVLKTRVEEAVQSLIQRDEEITLARVGRALGFNPDYLQGRPVIKQWVDDQADLHNLGVKKRQIEKMEAAVDTAIRRLEGAAASVTLSEAAQWTGLPRDVFRKRHPRLYQRLRDAVAEHRRCRRRERTERRKAQINAAATRLAARGSRLTYTRIREEAGLANYAIQSDTALYSLIHTWISSRRCNG